MITLAQIGGMIRYEALMQFRRRTLILIAAFFTVGLILISSGLIRTPSTQGKMVDIELSGDQITTIYRLTSGELNTQTTVLPPDSQFPRWLADADIPMVYDTWQLMLIFMPGLMMLVIAIPPLLTEIIPLDNRFKMNELMWTKPLSKAAYLIGKVLSVWLGLTGVMLIAAIVIFAFALTQFSTLDVWLYIRYWIVTILPLAFVISGYAVLLGGLTRSRRVALFIGLAILPLSLWTFFGSAAMTSMMNFLYIIPGGVVYDSYEATTAGMLNTVISGLIPFVGLLIGMGVFMWGYTRVRDA